MTVAEKKPANYRRAKVVDLAKRIYARRQDALKAANEFMIKAAETANVPSLGASYIEQADEQTAKAKAYQEIMLDVMHEFGIEPTEV